MGPFDTLLVQGPGTFDALYDAGLAPEARRVTGSHGSFVDVWAMADDEALIQVPATEILAAGGSALSAPTVEELRSTIQRSGIATTDLSSGLTSLRLIGPAVGTLLQQACAVDLTPDVVQDGAILQVVLANDRVVLARRDLGDVLGFALLVPREDAEHMWDALLDIGRPFGIRPVGGLAVTPREVVEASETPAGATP
jgi:heterotetrameric sarcosine oxidase gamma subunit